ncbi:MAG TPA: asparagine synthase-related protein [Pyrinomonadaceae bacterium]
MSAFAGIYSFNEALVDVALLKSLGNALAPYGPDGGEEFVSDGIGMTFRALHTNSQARNEHQPFVSDDERVLCWDGRLDNREELCSELGWAERERTDVEIVSESVIRFGPEWVNKLIGDFALALWESRERTLILARDAIGPRPLYYHSNQGRVVWSSDLSALIDLSDIGLTVNDEYVAGHLTRGVEPHLTPYKGIMAVPPGHSVRFREHQCQVQRFWSLDPKTEIRYPVDSDYEEHFFYLFRQAVRSRLRVTGTICAQLSGGLDSSSIVCVADEILKKGQAEATDLQTISFVYDKSTDSDERVFINAVEEWLGRAGHHLSDLDYPALSSLASNETAFPDFLDCFADRHRAMCEVMSRVGARVLLTGHGGDEMLGGSGSPAPGFADLVTQARFLQLHKSLRNWSTFLKKSYGALFWQDAIVPLLPRRLQFIFGRTAKFKLPTWLEENFVRRLNLRARYCSPDDPFGFDLPSARDQVAGLLSIIKFVAKASYRDRGLIEVSHAYLDRRLIEFLQAIPFEQRVRPGPSKSLLRRCFAGVLPARILNRKSKRGPEEALMRGIASQWSGIKRLFDDARIYERGYINRQALLHALERARHGCEIYSFALIQTISLEFWLRSLEYRRASPKNIAASGSLTPVVAMRSANACAHANPT